MVNWLNHSEQVAWRAFLTGQARILEAINQDMVNDSGLTLNEYEVLVRLSESPDRMLRMSTLADNLVHSRSRLTHTVKRLEEIGYVCRTRCPQDRRGIICQLTDKGYAKLEKAAPMHVESVRRNMVSRFTTEEFLALGELFTRITGPIEVPVAQ
ncbi:MarR family transcriptional regulator [Trueperella pyogenes]|uniref:MarR family transcriptional regulator n=1 Tax=Trueperella pyogenes TaxID=1661 RepID=X4REN0_9ACTO|nr:MarR family transcriptional regulator [Trueperella pyogenes]AHU90200.1 MarR family transcriptional regulator [Trueperella pyogenes]AJC70026.1 MarR family transcriptional regulator [Trueperella pyogenes TP8]ALD73158.1 MarR family transcriptional regulator [Trueperella pyogenes]AWA44269.1 MarR family transcriptional regulator [Trueperella pyogenes]AWG03235.1 MarR family transcriptional regulator [Trueperella pyogenes]